MDILLFGANGQVGWELQRALSPLGHVHAYDRSAADLTNPAALACLIQSRRPAVVVNAAAYTAVDKAESEQALAHSINAAAPAVMADSCAAIGALLVHYSTDYVFDGNKQGAYTTTDATNPQSIYGASKLAAEHAIASSACKHLMFRTSWVYAARGGNFAKTMLRLAQTKDSLGVVADQVGAPTGADLIADVTAHCIVQTLNDANKQGLYHLVANGQTSWFDYAQFVLHTAQQLGAPLKLHAKDVKALTTAQYPTPAKRPANSMLDSTLLCSSFGLTMPHWQCGVARMLHEHLNS